MTTQTTPNSISTDQTFWDDVREGDLIEGYDLTLDWTKMVEQVSGSQDFYPVHHDPEFAAEAGHPAIFYNTGWTQAALCRVVTDWAGPAGWMSKFRFEMRRMNIPDDIVHARGKVVGKSDLDDAHGLVELEVWLENDRLGVTTPGWATVRLPKMAQA
ncbi:MAG: MaoC/PaaZ C-terminal domain-containing protein [Chloroflexi bacterium]|nr:MaoC/PaaZ C-terminal domain-containing protein [Chloroflexota bacterium]MCY3695551.1 MaoC/PaaZ C-terminal domain-containing protein [Chloroflexota bacterium]